MSSLPSFAESLIVPLEVYEKKCASSTGKKEREAVKKKKEIRRVTHKKKRLKVIPSEKTQTISKNKVIQKKKSIPPGQILSSNLPADLKVKLHDQHQAKVNLARKSKDFLENITAWKNVKEGVLELFPRKDRETVRDIFELYLEKNKKKIDWNPDTYEVIFDGRPLENSHLIRILRYLLYPSGKTRPIGAEKFKTELIKLGVPSRWFGFVAPSTVQRRPLDQSPSWSTPTWAPLSTEPVLPLSSPIASRVKKRKDRVAKEPYTPTSRDRLRGMVKEVFDSTPTSWRSLSGTST